MSKKVEIPSVNIPSPSSPSPGCSNKKMEIPNTYKLFEKKDTLRIVKKLKKTLEGYEKDEASIREQVLDAYKLWTTCTNSLPKCCAMYCETMTWMMVSLTELDTVSNRLQQIKLPSYTDIAKAELFSLQQKVGKSGKRLIQKRTCKNAVVAVLREKELYENIIMKTKIWVLKADEKKRILMGFEERIGSFLWIGRTLHSHTLEDVDMTCQPWMKLFPKGFPSKDQITATTTAMEEANKILDDDKEVKVREDAGRTSENTVNEENATSTPTPKVTICCDRCKTLFVVKEETRTEDVPSNIGQSESKQVNESSPQIRRPHSACAFEENLKNQAWWECSSSGNAEGTQSSKPPSPVPKPAEEVSPEVPEELEDEIWESEEEDESDYVELEDEEDQDPEEVLEKNEESQTENVTPDDTARSTLLQRFKEFSEKFILPEFKLQDAAGWKWSEDFASSGNKSIECQTDFVDVDDKEQFGQLDPSYPLFEIEGEENDDQAAYEDEDGRPLLICNEIIA